MRRSEATADRRPSRGSLGRRVGRSKESQPAQQFADDNPTSMLLTRAQIQRKMRERSRTAALRLAKEQDKEQAQRQAAAARKSAAKVIATQARAQNALRSRRSPSSNNGRDKSNDGRRLGGKGRADGESNGNPPPRSSSVSGAYKRGRGPGAPFADGGVASTKATAGRRSTSLNAVQTRRREEDVRDDMMAEVTKDRSPAAGAAHGAAGPRSACFQSQQQERQRDDRARAGHGSGSGGRRRMRESQSESRSPRSRARATIPSSSRTAAASARNSEPPLPTLRRRAVAGATGVTAAAAARRDQDPSARTMSSGARLAPGASAAIRGPRRRVDGNPILKANSTLNSRQVKDEDGEEARRSQRERDEQYEREHKKTLAYMARQRKLALMEKRKMEEEKAQKAENLRLALEKLDQARRHSMSLPAVRSRTRENSAAAASSRQPRGNSNSAAVPQRRALSAQRRTGSSSTDATYKAAAGAARARAAWVNVIDGEPEPSPPEAQAARREGGRVLRRVPGMKASRGKENAARGRGAQRGVFLRRDARTEQERSSCVEAGGQRGKCAPHLTTQQWGVGSERESPRTGNGGRTSTSDHPARYGRVGEEDFGPGDRRVAAGTQAPRDSGPRGIWREDRDGSDRDGLAWMEHEARDRGREEEKESHFYREHPDRINGRGEGGPEVNVEANEQGNSVDQPVGSSAGEPLSRRTFTGEENGWRGQTETVAALEVHGAALAPCSGGYTAVDDRLPAMLETLERVARTVYHLRGRCDRLVETADARDSRLRTSTRRVDETSDRQANLDGPDQAPEPHPPRAEQAMESVPSSVPVPLSRPPPHRQHQPEQAAMRPTITVPTPVTLPPRQPPPLLRPASPHELAPPSSSSPAISLGFPAAEEGGGDRTFVPPAGLFSPSPGVSLDRDGSLPWREVAAHANTSSPTATTPQHGHARAPRACHSPAVDDGEHEVAVVSGTLSAPARASTPTEDDGLGSGTRRRPPDPRAERSEVGIGDNRRASRLPLETVGDDRSRSKLDEALEVFRNGAADGGRSASSSFHGQGGDGERSLGRAIEVKESRAQGVSTQRVRTGASGSSAMPSWSEWMAHGHGDNMQAGQENGPIEQNGSGSECGAYRTFSMSAIVAETIAKNNSARQSRAAADVESRGTPFADPPQAEQEAQALPLLPPSQPFSVIPSSWTTETQRSRIPNNPDLWDSLLEIGSTVSPARRLHVQGSRQPVTSTAVEQAASSEIEIESIGNHASGANCRRIPTSERESDSGSVTDTGGDGESGEDEREEDAKLEANAESGATGGRAREFQRVAERRTASAERRRLSPAELEAQLANEMRLFEDLHDVELQADGLMAAATVEEARQQARRAELLLHRERVQTDNLVIQQQQVFEDALARNDAAHDARLRRERAAAEEQAARRAEAVTAGVSAAVALSLGAQSRQAAAAVAAVAAAELSIMSQMQSRTAAQQHEDGAPESDSDTEFEQYGVDLAAPRDDEWDDRRSLTARADESPKRKPRRARNDFDSFLEHSPLPNRDHILHTTPPSARARARGIHVRSGFWLASPDNGPKSRATFKSDHHQSRCGDVPWRSSNSGLSSSGPIRVGSAGARPFVAGEPSPGRLRHSYDGFSTATSGVAARRQRSQSLGPQKGTGRVGNRAGEGLGGQTQQEFRRNSGPVGGAAASRVSAIWGGGNGGGGVGAKGGASMEYAAVRREIEREREAMSRRTQQQLRQLEAENDSRKGHFAEETHYADERSQGESEVEESFDEDARYSSFGSSGSESIDESIISGARRGQTGTDAQSFVLAPPASPGLPVDNCVDENGEDEREHLKGHEGEGEGSLYLADSLAQELQEVVAPVAAAGRPSNIEAAKTGDVHDDEDSRIVSEIQSGDDDVSAISDKVEVGGNDDSVGGSLTAPTEEVRRFDIENEEIVEDGVQEGSTDDDDQAVDPPQEISAEAVSVLGGEDPRSATDIEEDRVSARDGDDEGDGEGYDSESFEMDAGCLEIDAGGDVRANAGTSLAELYSPLVTPPRVVDKKEASRCLDDAGSEHRVNENNSYSKVWGKMSPSRSQLAQTSAPHASPTVASPVESREKSTPQSPTEDLDLQEGQKELDRLLLKAAVARSSAAVPQPAEGGICGAQGVTFQSRTDSESKRDDSRVVEGEKHGHARIDSGHEAESTSTPARDPCLDERVGSRSMVAATAPPDELTQDLLLGEHYTEIEPAKPPTLSDWIAFGAAEARRALYSIPEAPVQGGRSSASDHSHGERKDADVELDGGLDDNSFCSGEGDGSAGGDSEAELTALVAKISVRGAESRSALIVQALARGRRARRMAAAARSQRAAEEVAHEGKSTAAGAAGTAPAESVTSRDDRAWETSRQGRLDGAIRDMEWLTRKAREEGFSDSFESSDVAEDVPDTPEWLMTAESESELVESAPTGVIDNCGDEGRHGGGLDELVSPCSGRCGIGHVGTNLTVPALDEYDVVQPALSPAGMDAELSLDAGGRTGEEVFGTKFDYTAAVLVAATATAERGGRTDHANVTTDRWEDDTSPLALESPAEEGPALAAVADEEEMRASLLPGQEARLAELEYRERSKSLNVLHHPTDSSVVRQEERADGDVDLAVPAALRERDGLTEDPRAGHGKENNVSYGDFAEKVEEEEEESYDSESFEAEELHQDSTAGESNEHVEATGVTGEGGGTRAEGRLSPTTPVASLPDLSAYIGSDFPSADEERSLSLASSWQRLVFDDESPVAMHRNDAPPSPESIPPLGTPRASLENDRGADENEIIVVGAGALLGRCDYVEAAESRAHDLLLPSPAEPMAVGGDRPGAFAADQDYVEGAELPHGATVAAAEENAIGDRRSVEDGAPKEHGDAFPSNVERTVGEGDNDVEEHDRRPTPAATVGDCDDFEGEGMAATVTAAPPTPALGTTSTAEIPPSLENRSYDYVEAAAALAPVVAAGLPAEVDDGMAGGDPAAVRDLLPAGKSNATLRSLDERMYDYVEIAVARMNDGGIGDAGEEKPQPEDNDGYTDDAAVDVQDTPSEFGEESRATDENAGRKAVMAHPGSAAAEPRSELGGVDDVELLPQVGQQKPPPLPDEGESLNSEQQERSPDFQVEASDADAAEEHAIRAAVTERFDLEEVAQPDELSHGNNIRRATSLSADISVKRRCIDDRAEHDGEGSVGARVPEVIEESLVASESATQGGVDARDSSSVENPARSQEAAVLGQSELTIIGRDERLDKGSASGRRGDCNSSEVKVAGGRMVDDVVEPAANAVDMRRTLPSQAPWVHQQQQTVDDGRKSGMETRGDDSTRDCLAKNDQDAPIAETITGKPDDGKERLVDSITDELMGDLIGKLLGSPSSDIPVIVTKQIDLSRRRQAADVFDEPETIEEERRYTWHSVGAEYCSGSPSSEGRQSYWGDEEERPPTPRKEEVEDEEEEEWGKAQLTETIGNEGGIVIAGEEETEEGRDDGWDRTRVSPTFSNEGRMFTGTATAATSTASGAGVNEHPTMTLHQHQEGVLATRIGEEGGWGDEGVMADTYGDVVRFSIGGRGNGENGVVKKEEEGVVAAMAVRLLGDGDVPLGDVEPVDNEDEYYFPPLPLARPKKPWAALAVFASTGKIKPSSGYAGGATSEVSFGVRTGGFRAGTSADGIPLASGGETEAMDVGAIREEVEEVFEGVERPGGRGGVAMQMRMEMDPDDGQSFMHDLLMEYPEFPWWPVLAAAIEAALTSMSLDELNDRMAMHTLPEEPYIEELEEDTLEFPPPEETPLENDAVIPPRVIDKLFNASDEEVIAGIEEEGIPIPDRDSIDSARWSAFDAANEYLAEKRAERAPRRPSDPPAPNGKLLHRMPGFRHFSSMEHAILEVTEAILRQDGACLPGRESNPDFVEMLPLDNKPQAWVYHEDDMYFVKCKLSEEILEDLMGETVLACKVVFALRDQARHKWSKWLAGHREMEL